MSRYFNVDHLAADLKARSIGGGVVAISSQMIRFVVGTITTIVLARLLVPESFGLVGMVAPVVNFIGMFRDMGLSQAAVQKPDLTHEESSALFWVNVLTAVLLLGIALACAPVLAWFYQEPRVWAVTVALSISFLPAGLAAQPLALLRRQMLFGRVAWVEMLSTVTGSICGIWAAWAGWEYWALIVLALSTSLTVVILAWGFTAWRPGLLIRVKGLRALLRYGIYLSGNNVISFLGMNLDKVMLGKVHGPEALGYYTRAYALLMQPIQQIYQPISSVAIPALCRLLASPERFNQAYLSIVSKMVLMTSPFVVLAGVTAPDLVPFILGDQWHPSVPIFAIMSLAAITLPLTTSTTWIFIATGDTRRLFHWSIANNLVLMLAVIAGLPWGGIGVATGWVSSGLLIRIPCLLIYVGKHTSVSARSILRNVFPGWGLAMLCGLLAFMCVRLLPDHAPALRLALSWSVAIAFYGALLFSTSYGRRAVMESVDMLRFYRESRRA